MFNGIDYITLLNTLDHYGIRGITLDLFKSNISDRYRIILNLIVLYLI